MHRPTTLPCLAQALWLLLLPGCANAAGGKNLNAMLKSSWASTPLDMEATEFVAAASGQEAYWDVLSLLVSDAYVKLGSDKEHYEAISERVGKVMGSSGASLLQISLANREFSLKVAMYRQLAAGAWQDHLVCPLLSIK